VPLSEAILIIMGLLTVAMLAAGVCHNLPIPYTVFLVIIGIVLGTLARNEESMSVLLDFQLTPDIVLFLFLPALLFESAFNLNARQLVRDLVPVLILAVPALLISTAFIAVGLWFISSSPQFIPHAISDEVKTFEGLTPYARFGNWLVIIAAFLLLLITYFILKKLPETDF